MNLLCCHRENLSYFMSVEDDEGPDGSSVLGSVAEGTPSGYISENRLSRRYCEGSGPVVLGRVGDLSSLKSSFL